MEKDCCDSSDKKFPGKMIDPFIATVIVVTVILLVGVVTLGSKLGKGADVVSDAQAKVLVESKQYDWGTIDYDKGIVSKSFEIKNTGDSPLKLYEVVTSCMCTTAQLISGDAKSGKYGMHENSSDVFEVKPGESADLIVEFDPAFHGPSGVGPITRTITARTNDVENPNLLFSLTGNVVKN